MDKIRYRLVYNYSNHLNQQGLAPIALEMRQGKKKSYLSSSVLITPKQWDRGKIINHPNAEKLSTYLYRWLHSVEEIELDALLKGHQMTLLQLKEAVKTGVHANASLKDFEKAIIENDSSRCLNTKRSYRYLVDDMEKEFGILTMQDITYDLIIRYREKLRQRNLSENTIKGRLKALRCIIEQARLRDIIDKNPFENITIGNIGSRKGGLTISEVHRIERLQLTGKEAIVRDLFILSCYTGLRYSDLSTLEEAEIKDGIFKKTMRKTNHDVVLPIKSLFYGKPLEIINKYSDITELSHCCCNSTANKILKAIVEKAHIKKRCYFHLGRKTFSQLLNSLGMDRADITTLMGHTEQKTTSTFYIFNDEEKANKSVKKLFKQLKE